MKKIYFTVFNELVYDQRMNRICSTLAGKGFEITIVGKQLSSSPALLNENYKQHRLRCRFNKGKIHYIEFNIRLLFFLLFKKMNAICAVDLDTILPCYLISRIRNIIRIYDAHELFTEMKEVVTRPFTKKIWMTIERLCVPAFTHGYTVSESIAKVFHQRYGVRYEVIRNIPLKTDDPLPAPQKKIIIYQGAINEARGFEFLIPAMLHVDIPLHIYGNGNFEEKLYSLIEKHHIEGKVLVFPSQTPAVLKNITREAYIGINLVENTGLNQYYSLANKFFDYMHAGIPQITMQYPEYVEINTTYEVAVLIPELNPASIAEAIHSLLTDTALYERLRQNCLLAKEVFNWQNEEKKLVGFYRNLLQQY